MTTIQHVLENCTHVQSWIRSASTQTVNIVQLLLSTITICSILYSIYRTYTFRNNFERVQRFKIQTSLRITLFTALLFYAVLSCFTIVLKLFTFWHLTFNPDPCWLIWDKQTCFMVKVPLTLSILGYSMIVVVLLIERVIATFYHLCYSRFSRFLGVSLIGSMVSIYLMPPQLKKNEQIG